MWEKREKDGLVWFTLPQWQEAGARVIMTTRCGGISEAPFQSLNLALHVDDDPHMVVENRKKLLKTIDATEDIFVTLKQVHGEKILSAGKDTGNRGFFSYDDAVDDTDGIFTADKRIMMATFYADCLPIAVFHPQKKLLGLAHAGWKGTYRNIGAKLIAAMRKKCDFDPSELWCALGAGIGSCCYEVDRNFYDNFVQRYDMAKDWFCTTDHAALHFDNVKANIMLLEQIGVKKENISVLGLCTACHNDLFYSYRKERGKTGRHGLWGELI